ncbi:MAG: hypothetical protein ACFB0G_11090 [Leptolyngbyaceae cyanobacterium]
MGRAERLDKFTTLLEAAFEADSGTAPYGEYENRPVEFITEILGFQLTEQQIEICESVCTNRETNVQASHGVGKTMLSSCLVLWWVLAVGGLAITTAPTKRQVIELLWGEVRRTHKRLNLPGELGQTFLRLTEDARGFGFTASDTNSNAFQGVHHPQLLVIEDEACGISQDIDEGASSCATGAQNRFLRVGNPIEPGGAFEKACKQSHIRIPVWQHPNVAWAYEQQEDGSYRLKKDVAAALLDEAGDIRPPHEWPDWCPSDVIPGAVSITWIEEARAKYGEGSAYWQSRVCGLFPEDSAQSIVPRTWFLAARARYDANPEYWHKQAKVQRYRFGLDVGDGGDSHALSQWLGPLLWKAHAIPTKGDQEDVTRAAGLAIAALRETSGNIHIDRGGCGSGAHAILKEQGYSSTGVHWGEAARDPAQFLNAKAEDYWAVREAFRKNEVAIAPLGQWEDMLMEDFAGTHWELTSVGKIRIEDKAKTRKRLKRSPDIGDSVVLGFRQPPIPQPRRAPAARSNW